MRRDFKMAWAAIRRRARYARRLIVTMLLLLPLIGCRSGNEPGIEPSVTASVTPTPVVGVTLETRLPPTQAVVQLTPSPRPSATPTPTATPIIYQIEEGDTLLGIALARYTTVEEILGLNPGVNPNLLQIGQPLILPPPATPIFSDDRSTPIPINVVVTTMTVYETPVGTIWLLGEVINQGDFPVENIQVGIDLRDTAGRSLGQVQTWAIPAIIPPGGRAPFGLLIQAPQGASPQGALGEPATTIISGETVQNHGTRYLDLAVSDTVVTIEENQIQLSGVVENRGQATASDIFLVATFYDARGRVTGFQQLSLPDRLSPGETIPFQLETAPPGGQSTDATVAIQALRAPDG